MKRLIMGISFAFLAWGGSAGAGTLKVATYNVQNLFDLVRSGTEYEEYIPNTAMGWNRKTAAIKYGNIARVISDMAADIIALQEVESKRALDLLRDTIARRGLRYPYSAIADLKESAVKCALLSRFPITSTREIPVEEEPSRNILAVTVQVEGIPLILFVNHWKSKHGPESLRLPYARALRRVINTLPAAADFIVLGDLNSNYDEFRTFRARARLNDTGGRTGINHVLGTIVDHELVTEKVLLHQEGNRCLYNLWLEMPSPRRWSYSFFGQRDSPDNMIIPGALYDSRGISYVDNSFDRFVRRYLFRNHMVFRWQRAENGKGGHLGEGFSDHLPIFALFSTGPFQHHQPVSIHK